MVKNKLSKKLARVDFMMEMLKENASKYLIAKSENDYAYAGLSFPKNSNISKTAIKSQIVMLRNELLLLENLL